MLLAGIHLDLGFVFDLEFYAAARKVKVKMDSRLPHSGMTVLGPMISSCQAYTHEAAAPLA